MKILALTIICITFLSCKKEPSLVKNSNGDSASSSQVLKQDTIQPKQLKQGIFNFVTELCDNKGYYDESKYTKEELEGTYKLFFELSGLPLTSPQVFGLDALHDVRKNKDQVLEKLNKEFVEKKKLIENLKIVNTPFWQNVKKQKYRELLQYYEEQKIQIIAYSDPSILLKSNTSKNCSRFAKALNSDDSQMVEEWRILRKEMSKRNGNPQQVMNEFENHLNSADKKDYATIDLIVFGWGNCVNDEIERPQYNEKMNDQFNSLFIKVDSDCDKP
ncbi:hypothetical protein CEY12_12170 [Chryseobacterium sp. T16E-39]|uniref:hypothetical protein n=1 Tax=Chryseobacterium sp. T16E-39 TaxID=2015076 RepID=UPI000B5B0F3C|nr:hypothetical protein [Chryseobacterium sp. T16E-39]ASK30822.1 hypothetical protein CEY12_12170 [Chryseobacterium sp. T16E-39]